MRAHCFRQWAPIQKWRDQMSHVWMRLDCRACSAAFGRWEEYELRIHPFAGQTLGQQIHTSGKFFFFFKKNFFTTNFKVQKVARLRLSSGPPPSPHRVSAIAIGYLLGFYEIHYFKPRSISVESGILKSVGHCTAWQERVRDFFFLKTAWY